MTAHPAAHAQQKFTGKHMALIMVAFFGVIIAVNFTMAFLASSSWTGLVVKNSYVASQQFNDELAAAKEQRARGLHSSLFYKTGRFGFVLKDRNGRTLALQNLHIEIGRPAFEQFDQVHSFSTTNEGEYILKLELAPGLWALKVTGDTGQDTYRRDARLFVDSNGDGRIE